MADDLLLGSRALLNWIIKGSGGFVGLQDRLDVRYASMASDNRPKAQARYPYDESRGGMAVIDLPLKRPLVTIHTTSRVKTRLFHRDRHPSLPGTHAWINTHNMQWDIWARTPPELDGLTDALEAVVVQMAEDAYSAGRVRIELEDFEAIPYESETGLYRSLARGNCRAAQAATA